MEFKTTLEQWALLEKVIETGSFARAGDESFKSQSAVSYNLFKLQQSLGVDLLRIEGRKAQLTPTGELLLRQVQPLLRSFAYFEATAATIKDGMRAEINLVIDNIFPRDNLFEILRKFQQYYPSTKINFTEVIESSTYSREIEDADLMILAQKQSISAVGEWLMNVNFIAVAHYLHQIHEKMTPLTIKDLHSERLICILDKNKPNQEIINQTNFWAFSTVDNAIEAVLNQVGYGWLPEQKIKPYLDSGILKPLILEHGNVRTTTLHIFLKKNYLSIDNQLKMLIECFKKGALQFSD